MKNKTHLVKFIAIAVMAFFCASCGKNPSSQRLTAFPNPACEYIHLHCTDMQSFEIYDAAAQLVKEGNITGSFYSVYVGDMAQGNYLLKVFTTDEVINENITVLWFDPFDNPNY